MKFKPGDKVFSFRHGIVTIVETEDAFTSGFSIGIKTEIGIEGHTREGRLLTIDKHPSIIPLEKAEKMGFVRKRTVKPRRRIVYRNIRNDIVNISTNEYGSWRDMWDSDYPEPNHLIFMYFVDEQGNRCAPPRKTIEWEEI
jgi:hypothetical protein